MHYYRFCSVVCGTSSSSCLPANYKQAHPDWLNMTVGRPETLIVGGAQIVRGNTVWAVSKNAYQGLVRVTASGYVVDGGSIWSDSLYADFTAEKQAQPSFNPGLMLAPLGDLRKKACSVPFVSIKASLGFIVSPYVGFWGRDAVVPYSPAHSYDFVINLGSAARSAYYFGFRGCSTWAAGELTVVLQQLDVNYCASGPCNNGGACVASTYSFACTCAAGYSGASCETGQMEIFIRFFKFSARVRYLLVPHLVFARHRRVCQLAV